jgi:ABC-type oligopeptide transport system substrate-binding subunit
VAAVELPFFQDSETAYQLYRTDGLDITGSQQNPVPAARVPEVKDLEDFKNVASFAVRYVGFNNKLAPFDNANVRRAFALAVDKATLANAVLNVAVGAFPGNVPVHASLRANPVSDGLVTRQAEIRRDLPVRSMATLALANPVERGVGLREGTGRRHLTGLCEGRGCR